jgi:hypothetical protein
MVTRLSAFYDDAHHYFVNVTTGGFGVTVDGGHAAMKFVTGLLNSRLLDWFMKNVSTTFHGGYLAANKQFLVQLPIRTLDSLKARERSRHDRMVNLVERMLDLHKKLPQAKTTHQKTVLQREIDDTDNQIDQLVYELYGLTEEEIKVVEEETAG